MLLPRSAGEQGCIRLPWCASPLPESQGHPLDNVSAPQLQALGSCPRCSSRAAFGCLLFVAALISHTLVAWNIISYPSMMPLAERTVLWPGHPVIIGTAFCGA